MSRSVVRPSIDLVVPEPPDAVLRRFDDQLTQARERMWGSILGNCVEVTVRRDRLHFWSPQLSLHAEDHEDGGTLLSGRVGPQPHVWTMFVALYASVGFVTTFALLFSYSQWVLERPMWALWGVPLGATIIGSAYLTAQLGQRLGADQIDELMDFLSAALERPRDSMEPSA